MYSIQQLATTHVLANEYCKSTNLETWLRQSGEVSENLTKLVTHFHVKVSKQKEWSNFLTVVCLFLKKVC